MGTDPRKWHLRCTWRALQTDSMALWPVAPRFSYHPLMCLAPREQAGRLITKGGAHRPIEPISPTVVVCRGWSQSMFHCPLRTLSPAQSQPRLLVDALAATTVRVAAKRQPARLFLLLPLVFGVRSLATCQRRHAPERPTGTIRAFCALNVFLLERHERDWSICSTRVLFAEPWPILHQRKAIPPMGPGRRYPSMMLRATVMPKPPLSRGKTASPTTPMPPPLLPSVEPLPRHRVTIRRWLLMQLSQVTLVARSNVTTTTEQAPRQQRLQPHAPARRPASKLLDRPRWLQIVEAPQLTRVQTTHLP
jgi:hypothetical protein